jgi:hypothetical protein
MCEMDAFAEGNRTAAPLVQVLRYSLSITLTIAVLPLWMLA